MELFSNTWFWVAIVALILMIWRVSQKKSLPIEPSKFSLDDISYGFKVQSVDKVNGKFLIEYMPNLQSGSPKYRSNSWWYKIDGIPEEVLAPGTMFIPLKSGSGLKFQKVVIKSSTINGFGGIERTYDRLNEFYELPAEHLQNDPGYVYNFGDWAGANF